MKLQDGQPPYQAQDKFFIKKGAFIVNPWTKEKSEQLLLEVAPAEYFIATEESKPAQKIVFISRQPVSHGT